MPLLEASRPWDRAAAASMSVQLEHSSARARIERAVNHLFRDRIALVSSFGADSAVLLHLVASVDRAVPVVFIDTGHLFAETLRHRDELVERVGLTDVRTVGASSAELALHDEENFLWSSDPNRCCHVRKVVPLGRALEPFDAWMSGRKRYQASTRSLLPLMEVDGPRIKINPLADWSAADVLRYMDEHDLPRHELVAKRYLSIGCIPCTSPVRPGEDARSGRWRHSAKTECGIHTNFTNAGDGI